MAKAILVMDMPENCARCQFDTDESDGSCYCAVTNNKYSAYESTISRVDSCPLRELPEKMEVCGRYPQPGKPEPSYRIGWNACLDEILKEREADGNT